MCTIQPLLAGAVLFTETIVQAAEGAWERIRGMGTGEEVVPIHLILSYAKTTGSYSMPWLIATFS